MVIYWINKLITMLIKLRKRLKSKKYFNTYDIIAIKPNKKTIMLGSYNQALNSLILNVKQYVYVLSTGTNLTSIINKKINQATGNFITSKKIKIKWI